MDLFFFFKHTAHPRTNCSLLFNVSDSPVKGSLAIQKCSAQVFFFFFVSVTQQLAIAAQSSCLLGRMVVLQVPCEATQLHHALLQLPRQFCVTKVLVLLTIEKKARCWQTAEKFLYRDNARPALFVADTVCEFVLLFINALQLARVAVFFCIYSVFSKARPNIFFFRYEGLFFNILSFSAALSAALFRDYYCLFIKD